MVVSSVGGMTVSVEEMVVSSVRGMTVSVEEMVVSSVKIGTSFLHGGCPSKFVPVVVLLLGGFPSSCLGGDLDVVGGMLVIWSRRPPLRRWPTGMFLCGRTVGALVSRLRICWWGSVVDGVLGLPILGFEVGSSVGDS